MLKTSIYIIIFKVIGTMCAFATAVLLARVLGPEKFGIYTFVISILMFLAIPIQAGFPMLAVREASIAVSANNIPLLMSLTRYLFVNINIYYFALLVVLIIISFVHPSEYLGTKYSLLILGFISVPSLSLIMTQGALTRGCKNVVLGSISETALRPAINLIFISIAVVFFAQLKEFTEKNAIILYSASTLITLAISVVIYKCTVGKYISSSSENALNHDSRWSKSVFHLSIIGGLQIFFGYADVLFLGFFHSSEEVGLYKVAVQTSAIVVFGLTILSQLLHPHMARLYALGDINGLQKLAAISSFVTLIFAIIPAVLIYSFGEIIVGFIFGEQYIRSSFALNILVLGQVVNALAGSVVALLNMTRNERESIKGMVFALIVNIFLSLLLVPRLGMVGAAISTSITLISWNVWLYVVVKREIGIHASGPLYILSKLMRSKGS